MKNSWFRNASSILILLVGLSTLLAGCGGSTNTASGGAVNPVQTTSSAAGAARIYDFSACTDPCNANSQSLTFPANTNSINISWKYENFPQGAHYVRSWKHATRGIWKTYDCTWTLAPSGQINIRFFDLSGGLAAGTWTLTMTVNDKVLLQEQLTIQGNNDYWQPQAPIYACF